MRSCQLALEVELVDEPAVVSGLDAGPDPAHAETYDEGEQYPMPPFDVFDAHDLPAATAVQRTTPRKSCDNPRRKMKACQACPARSTQMAQSSLESSPEFERSDKMLQRRAICWALTASMA